MDGLGGESLDLGDVIDAEWGEEIESRTAEIDEGRVALISHEEVMLHYRTDLETLKDRKRA